MILWVFLLGLIFTLMLMILPLYSKQSELFINYIETNTGVSLKEFQKYNTNVLYSLKQIVINIYDNLYFIYEKNFKTKTDIPMK